MKKFLKRASVILFAGILAAHCNLAGTTDSDDDDLLSTLLAATSNLAIAGSYSFYDGTDGTTNNGPYFITNALVSQTFTSFASTTTGNIVAYDNSQNVFYYQQTSTGANIGKFIWVRWTVSGGKTYLCPDLNGAADTLAASQTEYATVLASPTGVADPSSLGMAGIFTGQGCNGIFWSRLESL